MVIDSGNHKEPWRVLEGDCGTVLGEIPTGAVDLVYADPPFATNQVQKGRSDGQAYDDRWPDLDSYLGFMRERLEALHRVLAPDGAILLHVDWRTSHHLRVLLDEIFGPDRFVNHLVWQYGLGGSSPSRFARKHDDILYYARGEKRWFEPPLVPATSRRMAGMMKKATDVIAIPAINNMASERTGWPTQKPLALLEFLVGACLKPGGTVLDPFCGSGTTLVAAVRLGRNAIGIDRHPEAIRITKQRLSETRDPLVPSGGRAEG
ncbi:MAG: site-specific DNA-methyltransferase [Phycisphaerales bacterium]|jgi:site-specific DNA-methyltransferase (adenine-specific)|nr:site-specific DNA-methyltransferase [Phycisphaerales bacterium]